MDLKVVNRRTVTDAENINVSLTNNDVVDTLNGLKNLYPDDLMRQVSTWMKNQRNSEIEYGYVRERNLYLSVWVKVPYYSYRLPNSNYYGLGEAGYAVFTGTIWRWMSQDTFRSWFKEQGFEEKA